MTYLTISFIRVHLYCSENDIASNLLRCFQSVYLYCSDSKIKEQECLSALCRTIFKVEEVIVVNAIQFFRGGGGWGVW